MWTYIHNPLNQLNCFFILYLLLEITYFLLRMKFIWSCLIILTHLFPIRLFSKQTNQLLNNSRIYRTSENVIRRMEFCLKLLFVLSLDKKQSWEYSKKYFAKNTEILQYISGIILYCICGYLFDNSSTVLFVDAKDNFLFWVHRLYNTYLYKLNICFAKCTF